MSEKKHITISDELSHAGDFLFRLHCMSCVTESLPELVMKSIRACEPGMKSNLCENVYISGGASMMRNLKQRLENELSKLDPSAEFVVRDFKSRAGTVLGETAVWRGGVVFGLNSYNKRRVTREEYAELGPDRVSSKMIR